MLPFDPGAHSGLRVLEAHARGSTHQSCLPGAPPSHACSQLPLGLLVTSLVTFMLQKLRQGNILREPLECS